MIKYDLTNINKWYNGSRNIVKCYHGSTIAFDLTGGGSPVPPTPTGQTPCYAVTDDISQYQSTEFVDVYDTTADKWYKLNNLNEYEEYGIYGSGRTNTTYYEGKLTIDDGYEYIYSGNTWVNLGEVSGSTRLPAGYTEVEYIQNTSCSNINTGFKPNQDTRMLFSAQTVTSTSYGRFIGAGGYDAVNAIQFDYETGYNGTLHISWGTVAGWTIYNTCVGDYNIHEYDWDKNSFYRDGSLIGSVSYANFQCTDNLGIFSYIKNGNPTSKENECFKGKVYTFKMYDNGTLIRDLVPCRRDSDSMVGAYDLVNDVFYYPPNYSKYPLTAGAEVGGVTYPEYYEEIQEPPVSVTFSSTTEMYEYVCPYVGLKAIVGNDHYIFNSNYEWEEVTSRLPVGYTEVQYISSENVSESVLGPYINTNYKPTQNTRLVIDFQSTSSSRSYQRIFGSGEFDMVGYLVNIEGQISDSGYYYYKFGQTSNWYTTSVRSDLNRHVIDYNNSNQFLVDGTSIATLPNTAFTCSSNLGIFWSINTKYTTNNINFVGRIFSAKVYDNGTLIRDLVPCKRDSDSKYGMYDIVNDVFYTSVNSYNFSGGEPV